VRLLLAKDVDVVVAHALLRDDDLFRAVDDKVATRIIPTFACRVVIEMRIMG
jgi:hypothetical protein